MAVTLLSNRLVLPGYRRAAHRVIPIDFAENDDPANTIIQQTPGISSAEAPSNAVGFKAKGRTTASA